MLAIQTVRNVAFSVKLIEDPIGIILNGCCENNNLKMLSHLFKEIQSSGSNQKLTVKVSTVTIVWIFNSLIVTTAVPLSFLDIVN